MKIYLIEQRSDAWRALRLGKITGTSFDVMAAGKKPTIETLCLRTAAERITGVSCDNVRITDAMQYGIDTESEAIAAYEIETLAHVQRVGFLELDEYVGLSPDGLVGKDGGVEVKCPQPHTHLFYLSRKGKAWTAYRWQVQGALWITGRKWWDFASYCPAFGDKRLIIERVEPDAEAFEMLATGTEHCRKRIAELVANYWKGNNG